MKKKILLPICLLGLSAVLAGCATNNNPEPVVGGYTIVWLNHDSSLLEIDNNVQAGVLPTYDGATPTKDSMGDFDYVFSGWTPEVTVASKDAIYTAQFEQVKNRFTIKWLDYDGTVLELDEHVERGATPSYDGPIPTREGPAGTTYTFSRWSPEVVAATEDTEYYAVYKEEKELFTVTWANYDDTVLEIDEGLEYGTMPTYDGSTPTRPSEGNYDYTFIRWSPVVSEVTKDITYKAFYKKTQGRYNITWKNYNGAILETDTGVPNGELPTYDGPTPTKSVSEDYSYVFSGWSPEVVPATKNMTYTAQFTSTKIKFDVNWVNEDGTSLQFDEHVPDGETPVYTGETPTKEPDERYSYTFIGWDKDPSPIHSDTTYVAQYEISETHYLVSWYNYDGSTLQQDYVLEGELPEYHGETPTRPSDEYYSYVFSHWNNEPQPVFSDMDFWAEYESTQHAFNVYFIGAEGEVLQSYECVPEGTVIEYTEEIPTKASDDYGTYEFSGWSEEIVPVTENKWYYAQFLEHRIAYDVSWYGYEGNLLEIDLCVPVGEVPEYNGPTPTRQPDGYYDYTFDGWSPEVTPIEEDGSNCNYRAEFASTGTHGDVYWRNYNGANLEIDSEVIYGEIPEYNGETPTRPDSQGKHYTFIGWSPEVTEVSSRTTIYTAQYESEDIEYTVNYYDANDNIIATKKYHYGQSQEYPEAPTKESTSEKIYGFKSWDYTGYIYSNKDIRPLYNETDFEEFFKIEYDDYLMSCKITSSKGSSSMNHLSLSLPEKINGYTLIELGTSIFSNAVISKLELPSTLAKVGNSCFYNAKFLSPVDVSNIVNFGTYSFYGVKGLADIVFSDKTTSIQYRAFAGLKDKINVTLPNNSTATASSPFYETEFSKITIPEQCTMALANTLQNTYADEVVIHENNSKYDLYEGNIYSDSYSTLTCVFNKENLILNDATSKFDTVLNNSPALKTIKNLYIGKSFVNTGSTYISFYRNMTNLETISASNENTSFKVINNTLYSANKEHLYFHPAKDESEFIIEPTVKYIENNAIGSITNEELIIPEGVLTINSYNITNCPNLKKVTLPSTVNSISEYAFYNSNPLLEEIEVASGNTKYAVDNGFLYNISEKSIIAGITTSEVVLPSSCTKLVWKGFSENKNIISVTIPVSYTSLGYQTFSYCSNLKTIKYEGTIQQFIDHSFSSVFNGASASYAVCSDGVCYF